MRKWKQRLKHICTECNLTIEDALATIVIFIIVSGVPYLMAKLVEICI